MVQSFLFFSVTKTIRGFDLCVNLLMTTAPNRLRSGYLCDIFVTGCLLNCTHQTKQRPFRRQKGYEPDKGGYEHEERYQRICKSIFEMAVHAGPGHLQLPLFRTLFNVLTVTNTCDSNVTDGMITYRHTKEHRGRRKQNIKQKRKGDKNHDRYQQNQRTGT